MIDWALIKKELLDKEGIGRIKDVHQKGALSGCAEECLKIANRLSRPKVISNVKHPEILENLSIGKKISSYIKGADKICVFVVTIGGLLEKEASRLMEGGDHLRGYLLDRIGSFAVESAAENFEESLRSKYESKNRSVSGRFSPGYCEWPTKEQKRLDKILGFKKAGIKLTTSFMMTPKKSISGIIGIGPAKIFSKKRSQCSICDKKDCSYRRSS
ncbi:MAG: vitamin B12 dependent-methionine synthase activation domain-containing protein [Candidatus Omnitrophota bacterium]